MKNIVKKTRLLDLRLKRELTQTQLSIILNLTQAQYSRIENDEYQLSYEGLIKLSRFYKTSIDHILGLTNETKSYPRNRKE